MARRSARSDARDRRLCAAPALSGVRRHRRRRSPILSRLLVVARFSWRAGMRSLLDPFAYGRAWRGAGVRGVPCRSAAVRRRAVGARLWPRRPHGRAAAQIWAADRACAADGAVDGAPTRRAGRYRCGPARSGATPSLAAVVARVQSGRAARRRTRAADGCAARSSSAAPRQADRIAARQGAQGARAHRCWRLCAGARCQGARGGKASGAGRRCSCERGDAARRGAGAATERRDAGVGADLGARRPRRGGGQHI